MLAQATLVRQNSSISYAQDRTVSKVENDSRHLGQ